MSGQYSHDGPGYVYLFLTEEDSGPIYIGSTGDLAARFVQHFRYKERGNVCYESVSKVMYCKVQTRFYASVIEAKLIQEIRPKCNKGWPLSSPGISIDEISKKTWHMVSTASMFDRDDGKPSFGQIKVAIDASNKFSTMGGSAIKVFCRNAKNDAEKMEEAEKFMKDEYRADADVDAVLKTIVDLATKKEKEARMLRETAEMLRRQMNEAV